jgi:hypothetical protein
MPYRIPCVSARPRESVFQMVHPLEIAKSRIPRVPRANHGLSSTENLNRQPLKVLLVCGDDDVFKAAGNL